MKNEKNKNITRKGMRETGTAILCFAEYYLYAKGSQVALMSTLY